MKCTFHEYMVPTKVLASVEWLNKHPSKWFPQKLWKIAPTINCKRAFILLASTILAFRSLHSLQLHQIVMLMTLCLLCSRAVRLVVAPAMRHP